MSSNDSTSSTIKVALILCIVCSILVSVPAVLLRPAQQLNKELDMKANILKAAGLYQEGVAIEQQFERVEIRVIDLAEGKFTEAVDAATFDQRKAAKDPAMSVEVDNAADIAKIGRRSQYALVYIVGDESGLEKVILPIKGYALWSTLYGFIALNADFNTVAGLGFYEHAETPGLGGEIDNPAWKALWVNKRVYDEQSNVALRVIKGSSDPASANHAHEIDGLSGATLTSKGVDNIIQFWMADSVYGLFLENLKKGDA